MRFDKIVNLHVIVNVTTIFKVVKFNPNSFKNIGKFKVSVQGVVALGGHFATFCQEVDFYDFFFPYEFIKKKRQILSHF